MGFSQRRVKTLAAKAPPETWARLSVGAGAKGPRLFDWAALKINHPYEPRRWQRFLLLRRSLRSKDEEISGYLVFAPAGTALEEMARIAGRRWAIEESFAQSKGRGRLGSVRGAKLDGMAPAHDSGHGRAGAPGDYPCAALCQSAPAAAGAGGLQKKPRPPSNRLVKVSVAEVRRFFVALLWSAGSLTSPKCCAGRTGAGAIKLWPCSFTTRAETLCAIYNCNTRTRSH
jgi:hypothetical protein